MKISEEECQIGELTDSNLAIALRLLRESGYVILESVLPRNLVEELQTAFNQLLMPNMENQQKDSNWNRRGGCHALYEMPFMHPLVIENSLGLQIIEEAMGKDIWTLLPYHTNTTFPGASMQHIHRDTQHLFPELPYALPPTMIILHIPLIDFNESNGSTQVWPGTHLITDIDSAASQSGQLAAGQKHAICSNQQASGIISCPRYACVASRYTQSDTDRPYHDFDCLLSAVTPFPTTFDSSSLDSASSR